MILSDFDLNNAIKTNRLVVKPFLKEIVRENGLDLRLSDEIAYHNDFKDHFVLDPEKKEHVEQSYKVEKHKKSFIINPNQQVLLSTLEYLELPEDLVGLVELRSTWARHGFSLPPTIIDAGFKGTITLEVINNAPFKILLRPKYRFAHVIFIKTNNKVSNTYKGTYLNQIGIKIPKQIK
ncbi:MAG: dCTP deaminase [Candidatus Marsarchaeota archaeon]|nr:dCTP deaminase [Candidatus Marsarchaeota archaeon]MCL5094684.1 dCTP deaminase [Candidatus Marsarchaeota archaeon]